MTFQKNVRSHKKCQFCWMSIEILASKLPDHVIGTYRHLSHTVLSCIVSCVHTSEQDVWCWWPWLTGTEYRLPVIKCMNKWWRFFTFFWECKQMTFYVFLRGCTRFLEHCLIGYLVRLDDEKKFFRQRWLSFSPPPPPLKNCPTT